MHELRNTIEIPFDLNKLAQAIHIGKAVVYTGAGTSIPSGLPGWKNFLDDCLAQAEQADSSISASDRQYSQARSLLDEGDYLRSAALLHQIIGQGLEQYVWNTFGKACQPNPIHFAITRIPFSLAITTNYDRLLESAYKYRPNVWTWRDPEALFSAIKHRRFSVVKIHGDVGNGPSLVLTKNQYRDLMHLNRAFNDCLVSLLSLRTFLFIGSSLNDSDLIQLMQSAKLLYGEDFGPHYAVTFSDEVDESLARLLKDSYNIHCVRCTKDDSKGDWRTESVCSFLNVLSGLVATYPSESSVLSTLEQPAFNLNEMSNELLRHCIEKTGSDRGQVSLVKEPRLPALYRCSDLSQARATGKNCELWDESELVAPGSFLGGAYLLAQDGMEHTYEKEVAKNKKCAEFCHSDSGSILVHQVTADGSKVGVVSVESNMRDAYSDGHQAALKATANAVGSLYVEFRHRTKLVAAIRPFVEDMKTFQTVMDTCKALRPLELSYLLYDIDYGSGRMIARYDPSKVTNTGKELSATAGAKHPSFHFDFSSESLAAAVLRSRRSHYVPDLESALKNGAVSKEGLEFFRIGSPLLACPVKVLGLTSAVLVCWSRSKKVKLDHL